MNIILTFFISFTNPCGTHSWSYAMIIETLDYHGHDHHDDDIDYPKPIDVGADIYKNTSCYLLLIYDKHWVIVVGFHMGFSGWEFTFKILLIIVVVNRAYIYCIALLWIWSKSYFPQLVLLHHLFPNLWTGQLHRPPPAPCQQDCLFISGCCYQCVILYRPISDTEISRVGKVNDSSFIAVNLADNSWCL